VEPDSETKKMASQPNPDPANRSRWKIPLELFGELVLLAAVGGIFIYMFIQSLGWPLGSALMPWIAVAIGAPFWIYRVLVLVTQAREGSTQIMDIGFRTGADPEGERARFLRVSLFILGLYLGIWLFGFHVALPLGVLIYVRVYGQLSWLASLFVGFLFLALLVGVYDGLLNATWHEPLAKQWFDSIF
jgi:hypothetical protein